MEMLTTHAHTHRAIAFPECSSHKTDCYDPLAEQISTVFVLFFTFIVGARSHAQLRNGADINKRA